MFEELYGPLGASLLAPFVTALTNVLKKKWGAEDVKAIMLSGLVSLFIVGTYSILAGLKVWQDSGEVATNLDIAILVFASIIWSAIGWAQSMGWYSATKNR